MILAIDPGNLASAYVILDEDLRIFEKGKLGNSELLGNIAFMSEFEEDKHHFVIEMVASYGMAVGQEIFETVFWIGRFWEAAFGFIDRTKIYRKDEKINLCGTMKAKDTNIRQALIDRFGVVGTKKNPGWFYSVHKDIWSAIAIGVTYYDMYIKDKDICSGN